MPFPLTSHRFLSFVEGAPTSAPPGGPTDLAPPRLVATIPDSVATLPDFEGDVEFRFDEVISEAGRRTSAGHRRSRSWCCSAVRAVPEVRWKRTRITVRPREGGAQPGIPRGAPARRARCPTTVASGRHRHLTTAPPARDHSVVWWWTGRRGVRWRADWSGRPAPDSLPYRTSADSSGRFVLGPVPPEYLVYGAQDQNNDLRFDRREAFDTVHLAAGRDSVASSGSSGTLRRRPGSARRRSMTHSLLVSLAKPESLSAAAGRFGRAAPAARFAAGSRLRILPREGTRFPRAVAPVDTSAAARARADSVRADSLARARAATCVPIRWLRAGRSLSGSGAPAPRRRPRHRRDRTAAAGRRSSTSCWCEPANTCGRAPAARWSCTAFRTSVGSRVPRAA
jgi:hypothetical protein